MQPNTITWDEECTLRFFADYYAANQAPDAIFTREERGFSKDWILVTLNEYTLRPASSVMPGALFETHIDLAPFDQRLELYVLDGPSSELHIQDFDNKPVTYHFMDSKEKIAKFVEANGGEGLVLRQKPTGSSGLSLWESDGGKPIWMAAGDVDGFRSYHSITLEPGDLFVFGSGARIPHCVSMLPGAIDLPDGDDGQYRLPFPHDRYRQLKRTVALVGNALPIRR